ncbi:MAG: DUF3179 domain-containing protein [Planctomyces sp.]|nr:DUF3179 domain-containing protein [Planctomyces sp.]
MTALNLLLSVCFLSQFQLPALVSQTDTAGEPQDKEPKFAPIHVLPRQPAIVTPPVLQRSEVTDQVTDDELVLGVVVNGESRAYPINMLHGPKREIINDTLGGVPVAAMWCHLCHSAIMFDRRIDDRALTFQVSGMLWNRTLVMYDSETRSLWSLLLEKGMTREMKGRRLTSLPADLTTWGKWKSLHPETTVLNLSRSNDRFVRSFYEEPRAYVFGFVLDHPRHIRIESFLDTPLINVDLDGSQLLASFDHSTFSIRLFDRTVDGDTLTFAVQPSSEEAVSLLMTDSETNSEWDAYTGLALSGPLKGKQLQQHSGAIALTRNWKAFYPRSLEWPLATPANK